MVTVVTIRTALVFETDNEKCPSVHLSREIREKHSMLREVVVLQLVSFFAPPLPHPTVTGDPEQMLALAAMLRQTSGTLKFGESLQYEAKLALKAPSELLATEHAWRLAFRSTEEESKGGELELTSGELTALARQIEIVASMPRVVGRSRSIQLEVDSIRMRFTRHWDDVVILTFKSAGPEQAERNYVRLEGSLEALVMLRCGVGHLVNGLIEEMTVWFGKEELHVCGGMEKTSSLSLLPGTLEQPFLFSGGGASILTNAIDSLCEST